MNPYKFDSINKKISSNETDLVPYLEFDLTNKKAWNAGEGASAGYRLSDSEVGGFFNYFTFVPDWDIKLSANFGSDDSTTSALLGTGDFGVEANLAGFTFHDRTLSSSGKFETAGSISVMEVSGSFVTQKRDFKIQGRLLVGPSFSYAYSLDRESKRDDARVVLINVRGGWALMHSVDYVDENLRTIKVTGDTPKYSLHDAGAMETELVLPFNKQGDGIVLGTRFYFGLKPNVWAVNIGYTTTIGNLAKRLGISN